MKVAHVGHMRTIMMVEKAYETVDIAGRNGVFCREP
jgi:hypothetical protein